MGLVGALRNSGKVLGPVLGGLLIAAFDFQPTFQLLGTALAIVAVVIAVRSTAGSRAARPAMAAGTD